MIKILIKMMVGGAVFLGSMWLAGNVAKAANLNGTPTDTLSNITANLATTHRLYLTTSTTGGNGFSGIPNNGSIEATFPAGFNISAASLGSHSLGGAPTLTINGQMARITLNGSSVPAGDSAWLELNNVVNAPNISTNYSLTIETRSSGSLLIDNGNTGQFSLAAGSFVVSGITDPLTAGTLSNVTVRALDNQGNTATGYRGTVQFSTTDSNSNVQLPSNYTFTSTDAGQRTFSNGIRLITAGEHNISARDVQVSQMTGLQSQITVTGTSLYRLMIRTVPNNSGSEFTTYTMSADQSVALYAAGYDQYNNYLGEQLANWSGTGVTNGRLSPSQSYSTTFNAGYNYGSTNTGVITATVGSINDSTGTITVNVGVLASITITPSSNQNILAGQTIQFSAASFDQFGNSRSNDTFTWSNTTSTGLFNTTLAGTYSVRARNGTINSNTVEVVVNHNNTVNYLTISPTNLHLSNTDQSQAYTVTAYDSYDNPWVVSQQASFTTTDPKGSFSNNTYNAGTRGTWQIKTGYGGKEVSTNVIVDNTGAVNKVEFVEIPASFLTATIYQLKVKVYDADGNEISNPSVSWSIIQGSANSVIDNSGRFSASYSGEYKVKAQAENVSATLTFTVNQPASAAAAPASTSPAASSSSTPSPTTTETTPPSPEPSPTPTPTASNKVETAPQQETQVEVENDEQGKIKADITTEGLEEDEENNRSTVVMIVSIILAILIIASSYWGYNVWSRDEETANAIKSEKSVKNAPESSKTAKNIDKQSPEEPKIEEINRW